MEAHAGSRPVRLLLVGFSEGFARSLKRYLGGDPGIALVGAEPTLARALATMGRVGTALVLLDMPALGTLATEPLQRLRAEHAGVRIFVVASEDQPYRDALLQSGADAVISMYGFAEEFNASLGKFFPGCLPASGGSHG